MNDAITIRITGYPGSPAGRALLNSRNSPEFLLLLAFSPENAVMLKNRARVYRETVRVFLDFPLLGGKIQEN